MDDYRYMVENMILEAANIIRENRYLRKENERLKKVEEEYHKIIIINNHLCQHRLRKHNLQ